MRSASIIITSKIITTELKCMFSYRAIFDLFCFTLLSVRRVHNIYRERCKKPRNPLSHYSFHFTITCMLNLLIPSIFPTCQTVRRWSSWMIMLAMFAIISEISLLRRLSYRSSYTVSLPFKNVECQRKHVAHDTQLSLKGSRSIVNISVGGFFKRTQNWIVYRCLVFISIMRRLLNTLYIYKHRCSLLTPIEVKFLLKVDKTSGYTCICMV